MKAASISRSLIADDWSLIRSVNRSGLRSPFEAGECQNGMAIDTSALRHFQETEVRNQKSEDG